MSANAAELSEEETAAAYLFEMGIMGWGPEWKHVVRFAFNTRATGYYPYTVE